MNTRARWAEVVHACVYIYIYINKVTMCAYVYAFMHGCIITASVQNPFQALLALSQEFEAEGREMHWLLAHALGKSTWAYS